MSRQPGMIHRILFGTVSYLVLGLAVPLGAQDSAAWRDPSPHRIQFVTVDDNVRLEVLEWGGSGRAVVLLAGLGNTAHVFDDFASTLTPEYHVYGVTRRGYGASSRPASGYEADRLGDDVRAVLDALNIRRPVLVGNSIAGQELSSVATRYPDRLGGVVYLDAAYQYAFDGGLEGRPVPPSQPPQPSDADGASFSALRSWLERVLGLAIPEAELRQIQESSPDGRVGNSRTPQTVAQAIVAGGQSYKDIRVPTLAIYAIPSDQGPWVNAAGPAERAAVVTFTARLAAWQERMAKAFEKGVPGARVVRLPGANHYVFLSHEADVLRETRGFLLRLR